MVRTTVIYFTPPITKGTPSLRSRHSIYLVAFPLPLCLGADCVLGHTLFLGSLSYSYDSSTVNREVGLVITGKEAVKRVKDRFEMDWLDASTPLSALLA